MFIYPEILIPKKNYHYITCLLDQEYLIRHIDLISPDVEYKDERGKFLIEYLVDPIERIGGLSMNLLGHFKIHHIRFKCTPLGKFSDLDKECPPNYHASLPDEQQIEIVTNRIYWGIKVEKLSELNPVSINYNETECFINNTLNHKPTKRNFWHFEIDWIYQSLKISENDELSQGQKRKLYERIGSEARIIIKKYAVDDLQDREGLLEHCFVDEDTAA